MSSTTLSGALEAQFSATRAIPASRAALGLFALLCCRARGRSRCRVALPGAICHEVVLAVLAAGCEPVFCDVDVADGLVPASEWVRARSLGADVAIVVHLYGNPARVDDVQAIFRSPECLVIDDAAQALGSFSAAGLAGALGDVGLLSFGSTKHISLGNAAVLFHDARLASEVGSLLDGLSPAPEATRLALATKFRSQLDAARARLRAEGDAAASAFAGLLNGMEGVLYTPSIAGIEPNIVAALASYPATVEARVAKAALWAKGLAGTALEPVGMGRGCVPWRYVCRLPGASWQTQHRVAEALRATGMHVSNWYLPAHWLLGHSAGVLPGVETLACEVFQFWVDDSVSPASIVAQAGEVRRTLPSLGGIRDGDIR